MTIKRIFLLSRPRFWFYTLGPFVVGIAAGSEPQHLLSFDVWYFFFYFIFPANLFIYGVNDLFDRSLDIGNPKKHLQEIYMKSEDAKLYVRLIFISALFSIPLLTVNLLITSLFLLFIFLGFFYSSPPLRFKTKIWLDSISNSFYIIPGVIGYVLVTGELPAYDILIAGSLWAIAMHLFSAVVDIEYDKEAGIQTTAAMLGYKRSLILTSLVWLVSICLVLPYSPFLLAGFVYPLLPLLVLCNKVAINKIYWMFPWINAHLGFILFCIVLYES